MIYKVSKLIPEKYLRFGNLSGLEGRCTGHSTGLAMQTIGKALTHPAQGISIPREGNSTLQQQYMVQLISRFINHLGLEHFEIRKLDMTIKYKPYKYVDSNGKEIQ